MSFDPRQTSVTAKSGLMTICNVWAVQQPSRVSPVTCRVGNLRRLFPKIFPRMAPRTGGSRATLDS